MRLAYVAAVGLILQFQVSSLSAQRAVAGTVLSRGAPLRGADVFDLSTLHGTITGLDGHFRIDLDSGEGTVHLSARHVGFKPADTTIVELTDSIVIELEPLTALASVSVLAGRFAANAERTATLTPLEVMTTPGGGDVNSTVKTLPGVQNADEGSGIFVRGGDYTETRTFIEGAPLFTPYQFESPTGSVAGTINPFLTDGIIFSAGGFGAQWGNALSGIVDLRTQGRPQSTSVSTNATLLSVGAGGTLRLSHGLGFSATASLSNLSSFFALNGNPGDFEPAPHGNTVSFQGIWEYSSTGRLKLFALRQQSAMGILVADPDSSIFRNRRRSDIVLLSLRDTIGGWRPFVALSTSGMGRRDTNNVYEAGSTLRSWQARAETQYVWSVRATALVGAESELASATYSSQLPTMLQQNTAGAPYVRATLDRAAFRDGAYAQLDAWLLPSLETVFGARTDHSAFATHTTFDPRVSAAWSPFASVTLIGSAGVYHQVVDPAFLEMIPAGAALPALAASMYIAGAQIGDGARFLRVEAWRKRYHDLVGVTRDFATVAGLEGRARGIDLFARSDGPLGSRLRLTWNVSRSRRQDPDTRVDAPAPFDVPTSVTAVAERDWSSGWHIGVADRIATGHPFTDVLGASLDSARSVYVPDFGAPFGSRLPEYQRVDLAASRTALLGGGRFLAVFGGVQNLLNRTNLLTYRWTRDYAVRVPVRSAFNRTVFVGANLVLSRNP